MVQRSRPDGRWLARLPVVGALAASTLFAALAQRGAAQTEAPPRSTLSGVYNAEQATRGEETYFSLCVACHPAAMHMGPTFATAWAGRPLSDLYDAVKDRMPKNEPGTLTPEESAQLVAYLLKINDVPAGEDALLPEVETLKKIRIEVPSVPVRRSDGH